MPELLLPLVGGLFATFLISRSILWALRGWAGGFLKLSIAHLTSGAACWLLAAMAFAQSGSPAWAVGINLLAPQLAWFCYDVWRGDPLEDDLRNTPT